MSEDDKNLGGPYKTKKQATKRLRQVEFYKNKGNVEDLIELKELEILDKKDKVLDKLLEEKDENI